MKFTLALLTIAAIATSANACGNLGCNSLSMSEVTGAEVLEALNGACFDIVPSNSGYLFQLLGDSEYVDGIAYARCDAPNQCTAQAFESCSASEDPCHCFTPFECVDNEGLYRCFELVPRANDAILNSISINFQTACVPTSSSTNDQDCDSKFLDIFSESLAQCLPACMYLPESIFVLDARTVAIDVVANTLAATDAITECIDAQFVGAYDCFAVGVNQETVESTSTTTTTTTTTMTESFASSAFN